MIGDHRYRWFAPVRHYVEVVPHSLHLAVRLPFEGVSGMSSYFRERERTSEALRRLDHENTALSLRVQKLDSLNKRNKRLNALVKIPEALGTREYIIAEIVRIAGRTSRHRLIIAKGARDGVYVGQPILSAHGILGHVVSVTPFTSTGILVTDADYALQVQLERTGLRALAVGRGVPNEFALRYVPVNSDIRPGDMVLSSGLDDFYPPDHPVGRVTAVDHRTHDGFALITLKPVAALDYSREVVLVGAKESRQ